MRTPLSEGARPLEPPDCRRYGKKELDQDNGGDAKERAEYAKGDCCRIKYLCDYDAALDGVLLLGAHIVAQEAFRGRVPPTCVEHQSQQQKVQPENRQGDAQMDKVLL